MTETMPSLEVMLSKFRDCTIAENSCQQAVPKLLSAAKLLIDAAEQLSTLSLCHCESATDSDFASFFESSKGSRIKRYQEEHVNPTYYQQLSKNLYQVRRSRDRIFDENEIFADPAWDILLDLTDAERTNRSVSVTSACIAACVPPTTGLRWVSLLEAREYVERVPDGLDGRRRFLKLTTKARRLMKRFYVDLAQRHLI